MNYVQRASKNKIPASPLEREKQRNEIVKLLLKNEISQGQALKRLRVEVLKIKQQDYILLAKVSRQTLSDIENDKGNYSVETLNQVFRPMGLQVGIVPIFRPLMETILCEAQK